MDLLLIIIIFLIVINIILAVITLKAGNKKGLQEVKKSIEHFDKYLEKIEITIKDEFSRNREESSRNAKDNREELAKSLKSFEDNFKNNVKEFNELQKEKFNELIAKQERLVKQTEYKLDKIREDNNDKLEKMRQTVDEKLHKTLEERLSQSFKTVSERLEEVHKGLGEMQSLATGVGDLKKVLSNVKTRGVLGEMQLGNILEQILSQEQYEKNVKTKKGSRENVEFAIKLPGRDDTDKNVWLPIDSKFPLEVYHKMLDSYDKGDPAEMENAVKELEKNIKKCAKDISGKYIAPPDTTDFGIMFLPVEGLYAEVVKRIGLIEILQREFQIIVTGPTTLAAFLNSLQMGFKTLAIEKRTSEVWKVLGAVKTEFGKFGQVLEKAQTKIDQASKDIGKLVGERTRQIQKKLKDVHKLPVQESKSLLSGNELENE